jgi:hypothetical protein
MIFRIVRARKTGHSWSLVLRTRVIARLILVTYALAAFGGVIDVGCCHNHVERLAEDHAIHEHVHSKNQLAVHSFIHTALLTDQRFLTSPCCCVYPGNEEANLPEHVLTTHRSWADLSIGSSPVVLSAVNDLRPTNSGNYFAPEGLESLPAFLSIHTIVLLI